MLKTLRQRKTNFHSTIAFDLDIYFKLINKFFETYTKKSFIAVSSIQEQKFFFLLLISSFYSCHAIIVAKVLNSCFKYAPFHNHKFYGLFNLCYYEMGSK